MTDVEREIAEATRHVLQPWIDSVQARMTDGKVRAHRQAFRKFADWCLFYQVPTPCNAIVCARFLLELIEEDRPLDEVKAVAAAIKYFYSQRRIYLDHDPLDAAIEVAEAQLSPGRVLQ